jgi:membrane protease YdiL (CAAX protease family)
MRKLTLRQGATLRRASGQLRFTRRQRIALAVPPVLVLTMVPTYRGLIRRLGWPGGYLAGFVVYWGGWCIAVPAYLLGGPGALLDLFREGKVGRRKLGWKTYLALWGPVAFPLGFVFVPGVRKAGAPVLAVSGLLGVVIAVTEEVLWRGVYVRLFPGRVWLNTVYPSAGFALWHVAPQMVRPNSLPGGAFSFVTYALLLGLGYAYYARKTGSIRWTTVAHAVHDALGLGGRVYAPWLGQASGDSR